VLVINKNYTEMHGQRNIKFYRRRGWKTPCILNLGNRFRWNPA